MSIEVDVAIIGAGIVGLAIAAEVAQPGKGTCVIEKNHTFGLETSSRNSEVIHAGIYYPEDSLKARFCVEGNRLVYQLCEQYGVAHKRLGKIIVAVNEEEFKELEELYQQGGKNGVEDLRFLSRKELKELEPNVEGTAGILSPSSGVVDSHSLMRIFYGQARERRVDFIFNTEVMGIEKVGKRYRVEIKDREGISSFITGVLINCAGLNSDKIARLAGIDVDRSGYRLHYCKGEYFSLSSRLRQLVGGRLIYPIPELAGTGIHITSSFDGRMRLGPNAIYVAQIDHKVDEAHKVAFYQAVKRYLPPLELEDLEPDFAGIRPKLRGPGEDFRDFVIAREDEKGLPGLINLIGIESPGLTAAPAIARYVASMVRELRY